MTDQRDQLAAQLKDATAQLARAGDLLNDAFVYIEDDQDHCIETGKPLPDNCASLLSRIDAALAGEVLPPAVPEPRIVSTSGDAADGFRITFPEGFNGVPQAVFQGLNFYAPGFEKLPVKGCILACANYLRAYAEAIPEDKAGTLNTRLDKHFI